MIKTRKQWINEHIDIDMIFNVLESWEKQEQEIKNTLSYILLSSKTENYTRQDILDMIKNLSERLND